MSTAHLTAPLDTTASGVLANQGLRLGRVDVAEPGFADWLGAVTRGFNGKRPSDAVVEQQRGYAGGHRMLGVWDEAGASPQAPVGTIESWPADLTVPGHRAVPAWAISDVTVAPTHRRRGVARSLVEAELRTAKALGLPVAMLTVSEATIYDRFGFAPAALAHDLVVTTRRVRWSGPVPDGRVHVVSRDQLLTDGLALAERARLLTPGQVSYDGFLWERQLGLAVDDSNADLLRFLRYDDADGTPQGFVIYQVGKGDSAPVDQRLTVRNLVSATDDAHAALWRCVLEHDLVDEVVAHLRPVDEPLRWMITDFRAVRASVVDHLWVRVLDVEAALTARSWAAPGRLVLRVDDPAGHADGTWAVEVDDSGTASVQSVAERADVALPVTSLGALYLGGVSARQLHLAGRLDGDAAATDALFASATAPWTSIWF